MTHAIALIEKEECRCPPSGEICIRCFAIGVIKTQDEELAELCAWREGRRGVEEFYTMRERYWDVSGQLQRIIEAWDALPENAGFLEEIPKWIVEGMTPAIKAARGETK